MGAAILDSSMNIMAHRFSLLQDICLDSQPSISIVHYFIENVGIAQGKIMIKDSLWQLMNKCIPLRIPRFLCVQHLVGLLHEALSWKPSSSIEHYLCVLSYYVGLQRRDYVPNLTNFFVWGQRDRRYSWCSISKNFGVEAITTNPDQL